MECSSAAAWSAHLQATHGRTFAVLQGSSAADAACRQRSRPVDDEKCPLCGETLRATQREFKIHVGKHLEEIALLALPREHDEEDDDASISNDEASTSGQEHQHRDSTSTSSDWLVQEMDDFPKLVDFFGTDWQAMAAHMKTKTPVMVGKSFH